MIPIPPVADPERMPGWSKWFPLKDLAQVDKKYVDSWSVYAIADKVAPLGNDSADPLDISIKIIGETKGRSTTLGSRCNAARQVLRGRKGSHGPASTLRGQIGIRPDLEGLAVAFYPVWERNNELSQTLTMALERIFIYNYVVRHGKAPDANSE